jgi:hypothetical protein
MLLANGGILLQRGLLHAEKERPRVLFDDTIVLEHNW